MSAYSSTLCVSTLFALLASTATVSAAAPISNVSSTLATHRARAPAAFALPDDEGWLHFDSVGMMMPLNEDGYPYDSESSTFAECDTVECQQRSENPPNMPDFGKRTLPVSGSRDLAKRDAVIGQDEAGDLIYQLQGENDGDKDDDGLDEDEVSDATEQVESQTPSALTARSLLRRATDSVSKLLRRGRKSKSSKKGKSKSSKKGKKSKSKSKGKGKGTKDSSALQLGKGLIMKGATLLTTITWYTGVDLLNPYCDRNSHWTPTDDSLIIAVTQKWSARPACGEFMEITTQDKDRKQRSVVARVVDLCGGCIPEVPHADLSKAAFTKLYDLDVGRVHGLKMRRVNGPRGKWSNNLYGPRNL